MKTIKIENTEFLKNLIDEIPYFLKYLIKRPFHANKKTRMWFSAEEIRTEALEKLVFRNNNKLESKMIELFYEFFESSEDSEINIIPQDALNMLNKMFRSSYLTRNDVRKILKENWNLEPQKNGLSYLKYDLDYSGTFYQNNSIGRFFNIKSDFILKKYVELLK